MRKLPGQVLLLVLVAALGAGCRAVRENGDVRGAPRPAGAYDSLAPLGSGENPVRANMPFGQREYLSRLVCPGGGAPEFTRRGSVGAGADGHMMDVYAVSCPGGGPSANVYMDMYHSDVRERRPIEGFTILPELPARLAAGCPPQAGPTPDSSAAYVFNFLEVERPVTLLNPPPDSIAAGFSAFVSVGMVVDTAGRPEPESLQLRFGDAKAHAAAGRIARELRFTPAEHHPGCRVRQGVGMMLKFY